MRKAAAPARRILATELSPSHTKHSINLSSEVGERLRRAAFDCQISESSIIEVALQQLYLRTTPSSFEEFVRERGGCLRRKRD